MRVILPLILLVGCASPPVVSEPTDASSSDVVEEPAPLCCQITHNETDSSIWHDATYTCGGGSPPWLCYNSTTVFSCNDPRCVEWSGCEGVNGTGEVIPCP